MRFNSTAFYGRARRMTIFRNSIIFLVVLFVLFFGYRFLKGNEVTIIDRNVNYAFLKDYFKGKGYTCDRLEKDGGRCVYSIGNNYKSFTRYNDGFVFLIKTNSYTIQFRHVESTYNDFQFFTNTNALNGYRNKDYYCLTSDDIFGEFVSCTTNAGEELDADSYIGTLEDALVQLNEIIDVSGYDRDALEEDFEWQKK